MSCLRTCRLVLFLSSCVGALLLGGCNLNSQDQRERDEKTRDEVAKATGRAKPIIEEAGRKLDEAVNQAAHQANAAAQGAREGWKGGPHALIDINLASENELVTLPGMSRTDARKIIAGRPYHDRYDLLAKGIVPESAYDKIRDRITAK
jgi:DNA uptake protein ComE-like DNA-binding protein